VSQRGLLVEFCALLAITAATTTTQPATERLRAQTEPLSEAACADDPLYCVHVVRGGKCAAWAKRLCPVSCGTCIWMWIYMCVYVCMCMCICGWTYVCVYVDVDVNVNVDVYMHGFVSASVYVYAQAIALCVEICTYLGE